MGKAPLDGVCQTEGRMNGLYLSQNFLGSFCGRQRSVSLYDHNSPLVEISVCIISITCLSLHMASRTSGRDTRFTFRFQADSMLPQERLRRLSTTILLEP